MKIYLNKKTTNADLSIGKKVAYKDRSGEYTLIAKIDNTSTDKDGIVLYHINDVYYMADELKLIEPEIKTIKEGQTLTARSIGDYECVYSVEVLKRNKSFVTVKWHNEIKRCKVRVYEDCEFIYALGQHSMAPMFRAN